VSDVVSRLGRGGEAAAEDHDAARPGPGCDDVPSVSMLGALVEALNASISATEPIAEVEPVANAAVGPDHGEAPAEDAKPAKADALPPAPPAPAIARAPEGDLLASFARMVAIPILAPEPGTAVIFAGLPAVSQNLDGRDIGERSDAVLRTAMPGHDDV
jgi:hypothetical protein